MRRTTWGWEFVCRDCNILIQLFGNRDEPAPVCGQCQWLATQTDSAVKEAFRRLIDSAAGDQPEEQKP